MHVLNLHNAEAWKYKFYKELRYIFFSILVSLILTIDKYTNVSFPRIYGSPIGNRFYEHSKVRLNNKTIMSDSI